MAVAYGSSGAGPMHHLLHDLMAGFYYVHRTQDDNTTANVCDLTFRMPVFLMEDALKLVFAFEGTYVWGETDVNKSLNAPEASTPER